MRLVLVAFVGAALAAPSARAQSKPSEAPLPSCMDQSIAGELGDQLRPRGVQKKNFLKKGQFQLTARGGMFAGDLMSSSYAYGGALAFWVTEDLGFEGSFDVTNVNLDLDKPVAEFFGDDRFDGGIAFLAMGGLLWSPIHAKLKMAGSIVHSDLVLAVGAGRLFHDSTQGVSYNAGLALEMFTTQWITFRFELRDVIAVQEAVAETRITNNFMATAGLSLWIPTPL
jgi:outer membrane beta-barrel protein